MRSLSIVVVFLTFAGAVLLRGERPGSDAADSTGDGVLMQAGTSCIATGLDATVDGYLEICPDDYGSWADTGLGGGGDRFNPSGPEPARPTTFSNGFFIFNAAGTERELLSDSAGWQGIFPADVSISRILNSPLVASDVDPVDGVDDTLTSSFLVLGGTMFLLVELTQHVEQVLPGSAKMEQTYTFVNVGGTVDIVLVRAADLDLVFNGTAFGDDSVGTTWNTVGGDRYVTQQEAGDPRTAVTLTSSSATVYYGGKNGIDPDGGGVPYDFGTDTEIWDAYGVPDGSGGFDGSDWRNHIAGVGYNTDGFSGAAPAGCVEPCDGFIGLQIPLSLESAETVEVKIVHWFGPPVSACCFPNEGCGDIRVDDCTAFGGTPQGLGSECATSSCSACPEDLDGNGEVRVPDLIQMLAAWGECPAGILGLCSESTNDCCTSSPDATPGCDNSACCDCICECDPICCGLEPFPGSWWDFICAGGGINGCGASNPDGPCADVCSACLP